MVWRLSRDVESTVARSTPAKGSTQTKKQSPVRYEVLYVPSRGQEGTRTDEDSVSLCLSISSNTVGDLEVCVAIERGSHMGISIRVIDRDFIVTHSCRAKVPLEARRMAVGAARTPQAAEARRAKRAKRAI